MNWKQTERNYMMKIFFILKIRKLVHKLHGMQIIQQGGILTKQRQD